MSDLGREIVVIGGGNVAMTTLRLSDKPKEDCRSRVRLFCLESREEMPAHVQEIEKAEAEEIEIGTGWGPIAIEGTEGKTGSVTFQRCVAVSDKEGSFAPTYDEQERMAVDAGAVILAIGQVPSEAVPGEGESVFLAGDIAGGQMSVVDAVTSGRAAERMDRHLGGDGSLSLRLCEHEPPSPRIGREDGFAPRARVPFACAAPEEGRTDFRQIEETYSAQDAIAEAKRCLQCDLRLAISLPVLPPERWLEYNRANVEQVAAIDGVFVLADADKKPTAIKGVADIREGLLEQIEASVEASFFLWEEDRMYIKRESELIQQHLQQYGELPGGGDDELDDLF